MKKINIYLAVFFFLFAATSCESFLDVKSESALGEDIIFSTEELTEAAVMGITVSFAETNSYRARFLPYYGANTDVEYYNSSEKYPDGKADLVVYATKSDNGQMNTTNNAWAKMYEGIERANLAIQGIRKSGLAEPQTNMGHLLAEAITLRAVLYLDLTRAWGDVPAHFTPIEKESINIPKSDRDEIYKQLIADLEEVQDLAFWPKKSKYTQKSNRINKTFIKALRAKICLVAAGYAQRPDSDVPRLSNDPDLERSKMYKLAEKELMDLYNNQSEAGYIYDSFETVFRKLSGEDLAAGGESLWEIPFSEGRGRMGYTFAIKHQAIDQYTGLAQGGQIGPTPHLFYDYDVDDLRRDVTCIPYRWSANNPAVQEINKLNNWNFGKYRFEWMKRRVVSSSDDGLNKQYMRFAEVLLMLAEVKNELYGPEEAAPYLKELRRRAFPANKQKEKVEDYVNALTSKDAMFQAIVDEQAFEFAGEMLRKEALIRWNLLGEKMKDSKDRMYELRETKDRYADVPTTVYYRNVKAFDGDENNEKLEFYGLNRGELGEPTDDGKGKYASKEWIKESELKDEKIESLFVNDPDKYQYWPIWEVFITSSNGVLKNDYGY